MAKTNNDKPLCLVVFVFISLQQNIIAESFEEKNMHVLTKNLVKIHTNFWRNSFIQTEKSRLNIWNILPYYKMQYVFFKTNPVYHFWLASNAKCFENEMCLPMICGCMKFCFSSIGIKSVAGTSNNINILNQLILTLHILCGH